MEKLLWLVITIIAGAAGGITLKKLKVPAGPLVGAIIVVGTLNILTGKMYMPTEVKILTKTVAGLFIGMSVTRDSVRSLLKLIKPAVILVVCIIGLCLGMGFIFYFASDFNFPTALFAVAPGGITDMSLLAMDMGGDSSVVALLQVVRLLSVYLVSLPLVQVVGKIAAKRKAKKEGVEYTAPEPSEQVRAAEKKKSLPKDEKKKRIIFAAAVAVVGGAIGWALGELLDFSSAILIVTMIVVAAVNIKTDRLYMPRDVRVATQILSGSLIGLNMNAASLESLKSAVIPALLIVVGFTIINITLAVILSRSTGMDIVTAMMSSSAGGATEFALLAPDFNADAPTVSVLQLARLTITVALFPIIIKILAGSFA